MTRKGTPRPNNGGARVGAGRKPTTKPLRIVKLGAEASVMLAELTEASRERQHKPHMSQADFLGAMIKNMYVDWQNMEWLRKRETTTAPHVGGEK